MIKRIQKYIFILLNIVSYTLLFHELENQQQPAALDHVNIMINVNQDIKLECKSDYKPGYKTRS